MKSMALFLYFYNNALTRNNNLVIIVKLNRFIKSMRKNIYKIILLFMRRLCDSQQFFSSVLSTQSECPSHFVPSVKQPYPFSHLTSPGWHPGFVQLLCMY